MTEAERLREERSRKAQKIIADPAAFMVCESCDSIVAARVTVCPNCYGYRFNPDADSVIAQASLLGAREQQSVISEDLS